MKKTFLTIACCAIASMANAQLKVDSQGRVAVKSGVCETNAKLTVWENPDPTLFDDASNYFNANVFSPNYRTGNTGDYVGVYGSVELPFNWSSSTTRNYGVAGVLPIDAEGAGVLGITEGGLPPNDYNIGSYAGLFYGETYADGNLTVTGSIYNLSDMRLKDNVVSLSEYTTKNGGNTLDNLMGLDVIEYNLKTPSLIAAMNKGKLSNRMAKELEHRHYGVSAQELQKIYPNLVFEGQDGYLTVNYTEMVPILLRCIQELKQQIDELQGADAGSLSRRNASIPDDASTSNDYRPSATEAMLAQNTPNPFTERTTIRFTLPDNAANAYIYIFDMTGKMQKQLPVDTSMQSITINGYELAAGMYIYSLVVDGKEMDTKRMILSK